VSSRVRASSMALRPWGLRANEAIFRARLMVGVYPVRPPP
jgi:hypothetical protein